ncbi:hypothetical protein [Pseudomonas cucumis]|uniref:Uncharacterized protein n=1 Tax=Pseudomonas cucumis TaxID=2954082 RepID=A0ABY9EZT1_9PSED|nr:hypothetical protein [Pseudomonas cucumis]WLG85825.1 hypothetical protein PSH97_04645 [Pseudomonas cucumis]WLG91402.1 hypothetical protein PSH72_04690 [Pseudomonas cucumis]
MSATTEKTASCRVKQKLENEVLVFWRQYGGEKAGYCSTIKGAHDEVIDVVR